MAVTVTLTIESEPFYVVAITRGYDGINQFFEFDITTNSKLSGDINTVSLNQLATLQILDNDDAVQNLTYNCKVVSTRKTLINHRKNKSDSESELSITLRPENWSTLQHQAVRVFEASEATNDLLNKSFTLEPTIEELERFANQLGFEADTGHVDISSAAALTDFKLDWWQNQLLLQVEETNDNAFRRIIKKMGSVFIYTASQAEPSWLMMPEQSNVEIPSTVIDETKLSYLALKDTVRKSPLKWSRDQMDQVNNLLEPNDGISMNSANDMMVFKEVSMITHIPLSCDTPIEYIPDRRDHSDFSSITVLPRRVNHIYDHKNGYMCKSRGRILNDTAWDFRAIGLENEPYENTITATIASLSGNLKFGDRDSQMRYFVRFNYTEFGIADDNVSSTAWLYRRREDSSLNGAGNYHPLPIGTQVSVNFLSGDREKPFISGTFITKWEAVI